MKVLLISMPFASVHFASMGLSSLRPVLEREGMACDILYQNLSFRNFVNDTADYDNLTDRCLLGEWVFGRELFGEDWAASQRGSIQNLSAIMESRSGMKDISQTVEVVLRYRQAASGFLERCMSETDWGKYQIIGFTSVYDQQIASLALAKRIKESFPDKVIAFGGANCQGEMGLAIMEHFPFVDWVFSGDAEQSFPQAIKSWCTEESLEGVEGLAFRNNGRVVEQGTTRVMDLNKLPYPDFADYFQGIQKWALDLSEKVPLSMELSRGCWWSAKSQCVFCGIHSELQTYRYKRPKRALGEISDLSALYGVDNVWVVDSNLAPVYYQTLLPALGARENKLNGFFVETKAGIKRENLKTLKHAGANAFQPGIESLDTEVLEYMGKGTTMLQNARVLKWAKEYGLRPVWNFLHSFPGENPKAYKRMAALVPYLVHLQPPLNVGAIALQRFSPLFDYQEEWKITNIRASQSYEFVYPFELKELNRLAYTFDYGLEDGCPPRDYQQEVLQEINVWKKLWLKKEPPLLAYELNPEGGMVVYDTRPVRRNNCTKLEKPAALALLACDSGAAVDEITLRVKCEMGEMEYPGDSFIHEGISQLEMYGFIIREQDRCLALAHELKALRQNNDSVLVYLLENG